MHLIAWIAFALLWLALLGGAYRLAVVQAKIKRVEGAEMALAATVACAIVLLSPVLHDRRLLPVAIIAMGVYIWRYLAPFTRQAKGDRHLR